MFTQPGRHLYKKPKGGGGKCSPSAFVSVAVCENAILVVLL